MAITIKDVAKEAGVSPATISNIINGKGNASMATKDKVNAIIKKLNYTPNISGKNLSSKCTNNIIFFTTIRHNDAFGNPHMFEIMIGIKNRLQKNKYNLIFDGVENEIDAVPRLTEIVNSNRCDGIILHGFAKNKDVSDYIYSSDIPYVMIGKPVFRNKSDWIDSSQLLAGETAAKHLWAKKYRNIAFIGGEKTENITLQRYRGADFYLSNHNIRIDSDFVKFTDNTLQSITDAVSELISGDNKPDAIICESNYILFTTIEILKSKKIKIPQEIGVIGFDNYPLAEFINPPPTVVDIDVYKMGYDAGDYIIKRIQQPTLNSQFYSTSPKLIIRSTT